MNLLMITRKIDKDDWLAGHSYEWAVKLSEKLKVESGKLTVICLEKGNTGELDADFIYSLGKEKGRARFQRFVTMQKLLWQHVRKSDVIFSHQNPEYAINAAPFALLFGKNIVSWYTHGTVTWKTRLMVAVSKNVLTASEASLRIKTGKKIVTGHGINVSKFISSRKKEFDNPDSRFVVSTIGRYSASKDAESLIRAVLIAIEKSGRNITLSIFGKEATVADRKYVLGLKEISERLGSKMSEPVFKGPVPHVDITKKLQETDLFVNLSKTGSLDKAVLEAMACEVPVITSNEAFKVMLQPFADLTLTEPGNPEMLADKILNIINLNASDRAALGANLRQIVVQYHNLDVLIGKIITIAEALTK